MVWHILLILGSIVMNENLKKIVIAGVPGSDNLGDRLISECIKSFVETKGIATTEICDISYREDTAHKNNVGEHLNAFNKLPSFFRKIMVVTFFSLKYFLRGRRFLENKLEGADYVIVGGGQLISDVDLNFPLKLYFLIRKAEKFVIPIKITSVGVSSKWSFLGKLLMKRCFTSKAVKAITVRDNFSKNNLNEFFSIECDQVLPDPAMMSSRLLNVESGKADSSKKTIGLGLADISGLNYSSDINNLSEENSTEILKDIILKLKASDYNVILFTNGALEDEVYIKNDVKPYLEQQGVSCKIADRFTSYDSLVSFISGLDLMIAFRLHANIIAASYNIPHYAICWDNKVKSFFEMQGRSQYAFKSLRHISENIDNLSKYGALSSNFEPSTVEGQYLDYFKR